MDIPNVLAERYATDSVAEPYSPVGKVKRMRNFWISVMQYQKDLGVNIPLADIDKFRDSKDNINLKRIKELELSSQHDVDANIKAFIEIADAGEYLHLGMTSRDLTDNVEQKQILDISKIIYGKNISILRHFTEKSQAYRDIVLTARTHHQAAQPTLLGRRFSMWAEELMEHLDSFEQFILDYPLRGIKGPVGTQADMKTLLGSSEKVKQLENMIATEFGFNRVLDSPGQVYPRSLDYKLLSNLALLSSASENFADGMRLMAGYELVTEGFKEGQVGSSAMPHKMNTRSSERIWSAAELTKTYANGGSRLSGQQWEEGDVSCSLMRRVIIPDSFFASDAVCETTLTILNKMGIYPIIISKELDRYLPFLATTQILAEAVKKGIGREGAHSTIKKHAKAVALQMRVEGLEKNTLAERLSNEPLFKNNGIGENEITKILKDNNRFIGESYSQIDRVNERAQKIISKYSKQAAYEPQPIL
ncbi:MAG: adenylosuccinate lyase [Nanoarchaeota archaeon]